MANTLTQTTMIRTEALTKFYSDRCAVRDLSVTIENREIVGFLGLNGAGKTTTLRMLAGQLSPSSGRIQIDGEEMTIDAKDLQWRIGFLPERPPLYDDMTVRRYLEFAAALRGYEPSLIWKRVGEVLESTATSAYADELISDLSHGFRQRVGIAQAIVHDPALVILDEPNNGLDPAQIKEMRSLIRELRSRHTVLLSSHILPEISQTCDRLMVIREGECVAIGSETELAQQFGDGRKIDLEVSGAVSLLHETMAALSSAGIVARFSRTSTLSDENRHTLEITLSADRPEEVAKAIIEAGLGLRRLEPRENELEAMFLQLTTRGSHES